MTQHYLIELDRYGGELFVTSTSPEFVKFWLERDCDDDLVCHVEALSWSSDDDLCEESPEIDPENPRVAIWDSSGIMEHVSSVYDDSGYTVTPVTLSDDWDRSEFPAPDQIIPQGESQRYDFESQVYGREVYFQDPECQDPPEDQFVPILVFHSSEKGLFGQALLTTEEPFNPRLLSVGVVETNVATMVERMWYNGEELEINGDYGDSTGKARYASVGWLYKPWYSPEVSPRAIQEGLDEIAADARD